MPTTTNIQEFSLFIDESGHFKKYSTDPKERETAPRQKFPDQIVGFFAPRSETISDEALEIMETAYKAARLPYGGESHSKGFEPAYINLLIPPLLTELKKRNWQPVRLVNKEKVVYGSRIPTYTNMVAELVLRILQSKAKNVTDEVRINLTAAIVKLDQTFWYKDKEHRRRIEITQYLQTISDYLNWAANQRNISRDQLHWDLLPTMELKHAVETPELQICDLLSNASHRNYKKCSPNNTVLMKKAFADYDQTIETTDLLAVLDKQMEQQEYGAAILRLAGVFALGSETTYFRNAASLRLENIVTRLSQMGVRGRNSHLLFVIASLEQLIGERREAKLGAGVTDWLQRLVIRPLRSGLQVRDSETTIDWFEFAVARWEMTAANHRGILTDAERALRKMRSLEPSLAKRSEHFPILMDGIITQSVHEMDTFDFDSATKHLVWLKTSLGAQAGALKELMPDVFEVAPRYELKARALGTLTLNLILRGPKNEDEWETARQISDEAISEFVDIDDKSRQYQIRCHLETIAGDFPEARRYLLKSFKPILEHPKVSHEMLALEFNKASETQGFSFQFALAHWLRIGSVACLMGDKAEAEEFRSCFGRSRVADSDWCRGERSAFPAHLILRFLAVNQACRGETDSALISLNRLQEINNSDAASFILKTIEIAAFAEVAALLPASQKSTVLIENLAGQGGVVPKFGIKQVVNQVMQNETINAFPFLAKKFNDWRKSLGQLNSKDLGTTDAQNILLGISREVCH